MRLWSEVLKSGKYNQDYGMLITKLPDEGSEENVAGCCMGILEHACGIEFTEEDDNIWYDEFGSEEMPGGEVSDATGLGKTLTEEEYNKLSEIVDVDDKLINDWSRMRVLVQLNDEVACTFDTIAEVLVKVGWDVDVDDLKNKLDIK
jgi:hypothetical protein